MNAIPCGAEDFRSLGREILQRGAALRYRARGGSMHPLLRDGDILEIRPVKASDVRIGDVLFFESPYGNILAHRLIRQRAENGEIVLLTRGDALAQPDQPISADKLLGRVIRLERGGKIIDLQRPLARWIAILWAKWPFLGSKLYPWLGRALKRIYRGHRVGT